ncbi:YcaO-like family protein [Candidatus Neptunochlamydia vexilliferae]|nr:YcaO-like family protein [Candidatus Neptunochlamydia vexilliferae]
MALEVGAPPLFSYFAYSSNTKPLTGWKNFGETGGVAPDRPIALAKALGEAVERYCSAIYRKKDLPLTSVRKASFKCASPELWDLYTEEQFEQESFPFVPFNEDTIVRWTPAFDLVKGFMIYIPAQSVYVPYYAFSQEDPERLLGQSISTGLACHETFIKGAISGICEVVERDALMITWQAGISPPKIDLTTIPQHLKNLVKISKGLTGMIDIFDITLDNGIPTFLSAYRSSLKTETAFCMAAATAPAPEEALRKSLEELVHTRRYSQILFQTHPPLSQETIETKNIRSKEEHLRFWADHGNMDKASFLFQSEVCRSFCDVPSIATGQDHKDLIALVKAISKTGHTVFIADITSPDIQNLGLYVIRAVIPGYQPLQMGHSYRALGGSRLWTVPQKMGYRGIKKETGDIDLPHPYP